VLNLLDGLRNLLLDGLRSLLDRLLNLLDRLLNLLDRSRGRELSRPRARGTDQSRYRTPQGERPGHRRHQWNDPLGELFTHSPKPTDRPPSFFPV
jgi:hypothetical protein